MTEPQYVARPVDLVMRNLGAIQGFYLEARATRPPPEAFLSALTQVLTSADIADVLTFMEGRRDGEFGPGSGDEFTRLLLGDFHRLEEEMAEYAQKGARRSAMDMVDLVEDLATDRVLSDGFVEHTDRSDMTAASSLVETAVEMVRQKASTAWSQTGRNVQIAQAVTGFSVLGAKASRVLGDPIAANQARWCAALVAGLTKTPR